MGYTKVYARQFLEVNGKYIPLALYGSSNVTELSFTGREVYERRWHPFVYGDDMILASKEDIMKRVKEVNSENGDAFMYKGKWLDSKGAISFFENGIKTAFSIEEMNIRHAHESVHVRLGCYQKNFGYKAFMEKYLKNSDDIEDWVNQAKKIKEQKMAVSDQKESEIYFEIGFSTSKEPLSFCASRIDGPVVMKYGNSYVTHFSENEISYTQDVEKALVLANIDIAIDLLPDFAFRQRKKLVFMKADALSKQTDSKPQYVIKIEIEGGNERLISKLTQRHLFFMDYVPDAKKFSSEKAAKKWMEDYKIEKRFPVKLREIIQVV